MRFAVCSFVLDFVLDFVATCDSGGVGRYVIKISLI